MILPGRGKGPITAGQELGPTSGTPQARRHQRAHRAGARRARAGGVDPQPRRRRRSVRADLPPRRRVAGTHPSRTPSAWPRPASTRRSVRSATRTTALVETVIGLFKTELIKPVGPGGPSNRPRSPPSSTSTGSTTDARSKPAATSHPPNSKPPTTVKQPPSPRPATQARRSPYTPGGFTTLLPLQRLRRNIGRHSCARSAIVDQRRRGVWTERRRPCGGRTFGVDIS
jgi:hypothetical protein